MQNEPPTNPAPAEPVFGAFDTAALSSQMQGALQAVQGAMSNVVPKKTAEEQLPAAPVKSSPLQEHMSDSDLWTWLKKDDRRQLFFIEDQEPLSEEQFMSLVSERLEENLVPASIRRRSIRWDNSDIRREMYIVVPSSTEINPITCVLQFAQVGRFSFVEQKTFLAPPNLPPAPGRKKTLSDDDRKKASFLLIGAVMSILGLLFVGSRSMRSIALGFIIIGGLLAYYGYSAWAKVKEIEEYNKQVDEAERKYNKAWDDWETTVFLHSFQEATNGQISRIYQAVSECIRQVNAEQFKDAVSADSQEDTSMAELEQQIARRKDSYR